MKVASWSWILALAVSSAVGGIGIGACSSNAPGAFTGVVGADAEPFDAARTPPDAAGEASTEAGTDAGASTLGPGPYTLVYGGTVVGIDTRAPSKTTVTGTKLTAYEATADEHPELGTNQIMESSGDALVILGRWAGGTTAGRFYNAGSAGLISIPEHGGFHYALGIPSDPIPSTGPATYTLLAKTAATVSDGTKTAGTMAGTIGVNLAGAGTQIGFAITLDVPGDAVYSIATTGGSATPADSEAMIATSPGSAKAAFFANLTVMSAGGACSSGTCAGSVHGFVAGPNAERIALVAHIYSGSGGSAKSVAGAMVFTQ